ncbi:lycopene cyclase family protein, partial [Streptomyces sp. NPDC004658]|uniref:lycopene cyclase family protein n=1 Tax=Streptomyces sp. NPDC004658 TaxID=3154672 RepID=UPI0033AD3293
MFDAEVAVLGGGAAGLSLAHRLAGHARGLRTPSVVLVDAPPGPLRAPRRTWCFWEPGRGRFDGALTASWGHLRVRPPAGDPIEGDLAPLRYKMIRSDDFEDLVGRDLARSPNVRRLEAAVDTVEDVEGGARVRVRSADGEDGVLTARWVFDSRPLGSLPAARTTLLQHFHGWFVRTARPVFTPGTVDLMDFRTPQPADGLSFGYVLPVGPHEALVEYTEFSPRVRTAHGYETAVRHYADDVLRLGDTQVLSTETGVIPMTDRLATSAASAALIAAGSILYRRGRSA